MTLAPQDTHRARWFVLLALVVLLGACGEAHVVSRAPGYDEPPRALPATRHAGAGEIEVIRGDTLYGVAFRNGMDFRELAALNGIEPPYTIYVGQILKLHRNGVRVPISVKPIVQAPSHPPRAAPQTNTVSATRPVRVVPEPAASTSNTTTMVPSHTAPHSVPTPFESVPSDAAPTVAAPITPISTSAAPTAQSVPMQSAPTEHVATATAPLHTPPISPPIQPPMPAPHIAPAPIIAQTPSAAILPADVATVGGMHWRWPAKGTLLDRFMAGDATKQGIDIGGSAGEAVLAASEGVVVYSGSGLVGYGELIIIKHSDEWLSAYGHNRKRLVQEGQRVKAGQPIAEMGSSGAPRDELHFEIRRNGRPVDPMQYLPAH